MTVTPDDVRAAVAAGDAERVRDLVVAATEKERRELRALNDSWSYRFDSPNRFAANLARWGSDTARNLVTWWWDLDLVDARTRGLAYDVLSARGQGFFGAVARGLVENGVQREPLLVRRAVREGLLDSVPDEDAYVRGLVRFLGNWRDGDSVYPELVADESLLEEVWRIFEVDCSSELTNAAAWNTDEQGRHTAGRGENRWINALTRLAGEGRLDRQRLLDASLAALMRDFRASMVGWYARLHEALGPTAEERRTRLDSYLALLSSPVPSVLKAGLDALRALGDEVPAGDLARAAVGPLSQKQKNLAVAMLALLEASTKRDDSARPEVLDAAAQALGHDRPDVQERALKLLERYPDEAPRANLLGLAEVVSPTMRARVQALTGVAVSAEEVAVTEVGLALPTPAEPERLLPVESVDELIELAAALLEGQGTGDDVERLLDGVSRLCAERPRGFERRTAGLLAQAGRDDGWAWASGVGLVQVVVASWITGKRRRLGASLPDTLFGYLGRRADEVAARAAKRKPRPLLAFPTHAGGRIDVEVLVERDRRAGRFFNRPDVFDEAQARVRALPGSTSITYQPRHVEHVVYGVPRRFVDLEASWMPEGLGQLRSAVEKVGRAQTRSIWLEAPAWGSWDALGARWLLTALPAHPEVAFAGAARLLAETLDLAPQLHADAVLEHALEPRVPLEGIAWLAVASGLVTKTPDVQRVATDVVVTSIGDGRFDAEGLALGLAWLVGQGLAKASRLEAPMRDVGRVSPRHAAAVVAVAESLLASLAETPHGFHAPLEVVLEHAAGARLAVRRPEARAALERIGNEVSRSSKLGRVSRSLLELRA